jgi:small conductance mechanosensitive channel
MPVVTIRTMPDFAELPVSAAVSLQIGVIVVAGLVGHFAVRTAVGVAIRHIVERNATEAGPQRLPPAELERRVKTVGRLLVRIAGAAITVIAGLMTLQLFGIDIGPAVAGLGIAGIAVGFGAQTLVRDWLAGIFVIVENQYNQGDVVRVAGVEGTVEDFSLRRTLLRDVDGTAHSVPNGQIIVASNLTRRWARIQLEVEIARAADRQAAVTAIEGVGRALLADPTWGQRLLDGPTVSPYGPRVAPDTTLVVVARVEAAQQAAVTAELRGRLLAALTANGIEVAGGDDEDGEDDAG